MRRALIAGLVLILVGSAATYGWVIWRNLDGDARAERACTATETHVDDLLADTGEWLELLSSEPERVEGLMRGAITRPCEVVREELVWWRWSWGTQLTIDMDPGEELGRAGRELAQRCPDVMREQLREGFLAESADEIVREMCGQIESSLSVGGGTTQTRTLWAWVDELEAREEMLRPPE